MNQSMKRVDLEKKVDLLMMMHWRFLIRLKMLEEREVVEKMKKRRQSDLKMRISLRIKSDVPILEIEMLADCVADKF